MSFQVLQKIAGGDEPGTVEGYPWSNELPVLVKGTRGRKTENSSRTPLVHHWRHRSLHGTVHSVYKWSADALKSSKELQDTPQTFNL